MSKLLPRIAIVVPALTTSGGVPAAGEFLYDTIEKSGKYKPELISLAMSSKDNASLRVLSPKTWFRGVQVVNGIWHDKNYQHIGAELVELESQRYKPRNPLTQLLNTYDLVQIVAGTPAWALTAKHVKPPVLLHVATLTHVERRMKLANGRGPKGMWQRVMTHAVSQFDFSALEYTEAVFVMNHWMQRLLTERLGSSKVILAPPGVDTAFFTPLEGSSDKKYILSVGRFADPRKNVRLLFRAYKKLLEAYPDAPKLVLAGKTGPTVDDLNFAQSLGIAGRIEIKLEVSLSELADLYRHACCFVLSSDEEGLGIVILEAMASGLPVISTQSGGPEVTVIDGLTGYLTPLNDETTLATKMHELSTNDVLRQTMGKEARKQAEGSFSQDATSRPFLNLYSALLENA